GLFSYGKLHIAYGETGKEPPVYAAVTTLNTQYTPGSGYGDVIKTTIGGVGGIVTNIRLGNQSLRPERNRETEFGADLAFLRNKVDLSAVYYNKRSSDLILNVPISAAQTGSTQAYENAATLRNEGTELTLNAHPFNNERLAWDVGMQFGRNRGIVTSLAGAQFITYNLEGFNGAIGSSTVGFAPGVIRGVDFARCGRGIVLADGTDIDKACGAAPKNALYLAANGQPIPEGGQRVIADPNPKYTMSYNSTLRVGSKLRFSGLLDVRKGGSVWNGTRGILDYFGTASETLIRNSTNGQFGKNYLTGVYPTVAGPGAGVVAFKTPQQWQAWFNGNGGGFGPVGAQFVEDGSFAKLRELSVTYTADQSWVHALSGFSSVDLRVAGRNLKTWTRYKGLDPEANLGGSEFLTQGIDYFNNPQVRSFVFSVSLNR
ncbi:MAG TPA: TonB-dependent receptor, partial [Candidatus Elarobacter sp.]|nr:TonB-dependent receptor [Candidatus Elarobacter sp.]